jgi:FAD/FMN-containing dehydrogenase
MKFIVWRDESSPELYEKERTKRLFNAIIPQRFPLAIASVKTEQDIVDTVKLAVARNCRISVRAGGHSYAAWSVRDDVMLVDMGDYHECEIDEDGVARVSPSLTGRELHDFLGERGRVFPVGHCPDVGLGGYLLGGGMGWSQTVRVFTT